MQNKLEKDKCSGTVIKLPKTDRVFLFISFLIHARCGADLVFGSLATMLYIRFRPKLALTLEIPSSKLQICYLPHVTTREGFRGSKSALCHLLWEATCPLRTDKQLGNVKLMNHRPRAALR